VNILERSRRARIDSIQLSAQVSYNLPGSRDICMPWRCPHIYLPGMGRNDLTPSLQRSSLEHKVCITASPEMALFRRIHIQYNWHLLYSLNTAPSDNQCIVSMQHLWRKYQDRRPCSLFVLHLKRNLLYNLGILTWLFVLAHRCVSQLGKECNYFCCFCL
jgi:hypothetical protein